MTDFSAHFRFPIPDFLQDPWHAELTATIRAIDTAIYQALLIQEVDFWLNATIYGVGAIVIDSATGLMWTCAVANTSSASPTTFAQERVAHPTFWNATATIPQQRGAWTTATSYIPGDFVVESNRYAVCLVAHVSAAAFNTDLAAARWVILIDLSSLGVGINATAEGTIASAATTDIGGQAPTRLNVTGVTNIASFGVVANTYKILRFSGILTITHSANIILIGATNRTTAAGDQMWVSSDNTGKWREIMFTPATGVPPGVPDASTATKGIIEIATQPEVDADADTIRAVVPATLGVRLATLSSSILATIRGGVGATLDTLLEIADAIGLLAPKANPTFTGTATIPTAAITTGNIATLNVSGGTNLPAGDISLTDLAPTAKAFEGNRYQIRDERSSGTDGDVLTTATWNTRTLNTEKVDDLGITPSSNQLALAAGTYYVEAEVATAFLGTNTRGASLVAASKLRIRNITDGATLVTGLTRRWVSADDGGGNDEFNDITLETTLADYFTIAGTKTIELQNYVINNYVSVPQTKGGRAITSGEVEVYANLRLWKIG